MHRLYSTVEEKDEARRLVGQSILAAGGDAVAAADRGGIIRIWNRGAERIFGYDADGAVGQSLDLIIPRGSLGRLAPPSLGAISASAYLWTTTFESRCRGQSCAGEPSASQTAPSK